MSSRPGNLATRSTELADWAALRKELASGEERLQKLTAYCAAHPDSERRELEVLTRRVQLLRKYAGLARSKVDEKLASRMTQGLAEPLASRGPEVPRRSEAFDVLSSSQRRQAWAGDIDTKEMIAKCRLTLEKLHAVWDGVKSPDIAPKPLQ